MGRRQAARAAAEAETQALVAGNERIGRLIEQYLEQRTGVGDISPWELPIVVACRRTIAETISPLGLLSYRDSYPVPNQPPVLARPDPDETLRQTLARFIDNLTGSGYVWLHPSVWYTDGWPAVVRVVDAARATAEFDPDGRMRTIWYLGESYEPGHLREGGMVHVPYAQPLAGELGRSPFADAWRILEHLAGLWQMAGSFWEAGFPSLAITIQQAMTAPQRRELKAELLDAWSRGHEPAVVDRGGTITPVGSSAVEAQLVESIGAMNAEVTRLVGLAPSMVNVQSAGSLTYSTAEGELSRWLKLGAAGYLARIEDAFGYATPLGQQCRVDTGELLRTDQAARAAWYTAGLTGGWLTIDEVRGAEGLRPIGAAARQPAAVLNTPPTQPGVPA